MHAEHAASAWDVARRHLEESLEIYRRLRNEQGAAAVLQNLGRISAELGEWAAAFAFLDESLAIGRRLKNRPVTALSLFNLGYAQLLEGDLPSARARLEEGLEAFRELDDEFWIDACLVYLGYIDCEEGEYAAARSRFIQTGETLPLVQFPWGATYMLDGFARLAAAEGEAVRALRLGGATTALRQTYGVTIGPTGQGAFRRSLEPAWRALGEEAGETAWEEGRSMTLEEALDLAYAEPGAKPNRPPEGPLSARARSPLARRQGDHGRRSGRKPVREPPHRKQASEGRLPQARGKEQDRGRQEGGRARPDLTAVCISSEPA
jgi:tetratricopeptide (TPR) repeat protein